MTQVYLIQKLKLKESNTLFLYANRLPLILLRNKDPYIPTVWTLLRENVGLLTPSQPYMRQALDKIMPNNNSFTMIKTFLMSIEFVRK